MNQALELNPPVLEILKPDCDHELFGWGRSKIKIPECDADHALFHVKVTPDGPREFQPLSAAQSGQRIRGNPYDLIVRVALSVSDFTLAFPAVQEDSQHHAYDFQGVGVLSVTEPQRFAEQFMPLAALGAPLRRDRLAVWLGQELTAHVRRTLDDTLRDRPFEELREEAVLPSGWWEERLRAPLERFHVRLGGLRVGWDSASARRAEQLQKERDAQERQRQQAQAEEEQRVKQARRDQQLAAELAQIEADQRVEQARVQAKLDADLAQIEADKSRTLRDVEVARGAGAEQLQRLEEDYAQRRLQAEQKYREAQLEGEARLQAIRHDMERRASEHEVAMARIWVDFEDERKEKAEKRRRDNEAALQAAAQCAEAAEAKFALLTERVKQATDATVHQRELAQLDQELKKAQVAKANAEAEAARLAAEAAKHRELESQAREAEARAALAREREEVLEQKRRIFEQQRELLLLRLQQEQEKVRQEKAKADAEVRVAAERAEAARLERERAELDRRRADQELQRAEASRKHLDQVQASEKDHLTRLEGVLERIMKLFTSGILQKLLSGRPGQAYDAAGWVTHLGVSAQDLKDLGIMTQQSFIERFQANTVEIRKTNLAQRDITTRDITTGPEQELAVDTLPIKERVDFEFTSPRSGYVTIINPGTSGAFLLHAPNAYRAAPRVEAHRTYQVPGPEVLPREELARNGLAFYEGGPTGWEYLVVIVSDELVVNEAIVARSTPKAPIVELSTDEVQGIVDRLDQLGRDRWVAGVRQFRVENR